MIMTAPKRASNSRSERGYGARASRRASRSSARAFSPEQKESHTDQLVIFGTKARARDVRLRQAFPGEDDSMSAQPITMPWSMTSSKYSSGWETRRHSSSQFRQLFRAAILPANARRRGSRTPMMRSTPGSNPELNARYSGSPMLSSSRLISSRSDMTSLPALPGASGFRAESENRQHTKRSIFPLGFPCLRKRAAYQDQAE